MRKAREIFQNIYLSEETTEEKVDAIRKVIGMETHNSFTKQEFINALDWLLNELPKHNGWIPFTDRELTEEEKEHYGEDVECMLDCKLPEEDEEILITYKFKGELYVNTDTFMRDGSECYLDSGMEFITEAIAWQPLPEPFKQEGEHNE